MEILLHAHSLQHANRMRAKVKIERIRNLSGPVLCQIKMRHLTGRMHARIRPARAINFHRPAIQFRRRRFQASLHRQFIGQPLPQPPDLRLD